MKCDEILFSLEACGPTARRQALLHCQGCAACRQAALDWREIQVGLKTVATTTDRHRAAWMKACSGPPAVANSWDWRRPPLRIAACAAALALALVGGAHLLKSKPRDEVAKRPPETLIANPGRAVVLVKAGAIRAQIRTALGELDRLEKRVSLFDEFQQTAQLEAKFGKRFGRSGSEGAWIP